jgi:hypothetical protein
MQTQTETRQGAEDKIFAFRRKIEQYAAVGDSEEVARIQLEISAIQRKQGAVTGTRRKNDEPKA